MSLHEFEMMLRLTAIIFVLAGAVIGGAVIGVAGHQIPWNAPMKPWFEEWMNEMRNSAPTLNEMYNPAPSMPNELNVNPWENLPQDFGNFGNPMYKKCAIETTTCSIKESLKGPSFAYELYKQDNPPPVPESGIQSSINAIAKKANDAARLLFHAKNLKGIAESERDVVQRAKWMEKRASMELEAEEAKGDAAEIARGITRRGLAYEEIASIMIRIRKEAKSVWMNIEIDYPEDGVYAVLNQIDLLQQIDLEEDLSPLIDDIAGLVKEACKIQVEQDKISARLVEERSQFVTTFMEQKLATDRMEIRAKAALINNHLSRMITKQEVPEIQRRLALLNEALNPCKEVPTVTSG